MVVAAAENGRMAKAHKSEGGRSEGGRAEGGKGAKARSGGGAASFLDANPLLKNTLAQIEKEFGEGSIMPLGTEAQKEIEGISF